MSYTHKKVGWERCLKTNGSIVNSYGDVTRVGAYVCSETLICGTFKVTDLRQVLVRKQPKTTVIKSSDGREILTKSVFYADPRIEPNALNISKMDLLDGELVEDIYVMCDLHNRPKLVRLVTV